MFVVERLGQEQKQSSVMRVILYQMTSVLLPFSCYVSWRFLACSQSVLTGRLRGILLKHKAQHPTALVVAEHRLQHCTDASKMVGISDAPNVEHHVLAKDTHC